MIRSSIALPALLCACAAAVAFAPLAEVEPKPGRGRAIYRTLALGGDHKEMTRRLNEYAAEGWEFVAALEKGTGAFKRPYVTSFGPAQRKLLDKLNGAWTITSSEHNGAAVALGDDPITVTFDGQKSATRIGKKVSQAGTVQYIAASGDNIIIDMLIEEGTDEESVHFTARCIVKLDGDSMQYSAGGYGSARPKDFTTKEGDGFQANVLKRSR